jgi:hypothetical protein
MPEKATAVTETAWGLQIQGQALTSRRALRTKLKESVLERPPVDRDVFELQALGSVRITDPHMHIRDVPVEIRLSAEAFRVKRSEVTIGGQGTGRLEIRSVQSESPWGPDSLLFSEVSGYLACEHPDIAVEVQASGSTSVLQIRDRIPEGPLVSSLVIGTPELPETLEISLETIQWRSTVSAFPFCEQDLPKKPKKPGIREAILIGVSDGTPKDQKTTQESLDQIGSAVKDKWGFHILDDLREGKATKEKILKSIDKLIKRLKSLNEKKEKPDECYIKIHFQGHGIIGDAKDEDDEKNNDDEGFRTATEPLWDTELFERLLKLREELKKFDKSNLIVELDFCFAQGMYEDLIGAATPGMNLSWNSEEDKLCSAKAGFATPYTRGFMMAFDKHGCSTTVEQAHEAAEEANLLEITPGKKEVYSPGHQDGDPDDDTKPGCCDE